jgi:transcriptional regulator with XRE-family HTH domain
MTGASQTGRYKEFLRQLRAARLKANLTQVEVAEKLKKPQSWVSKSESGERRVDVVELEQLAELYGKPLSYFLPGSTV